MKINVFRHQNIAGWFGGFGYKNKLDYFEKNGKNKLGWETDNSNNFYFNFIFKKFIRSSWKKDGKN